MRTDQESVAVTKSIDLAVEVVQFHTSLIAKGYPDLARQLLRSGTSVGANISEAQNAESSRDFLHKMKIAAKELSETIFWLKVCNASEHLPSSKILNQKSSELMRILGKIISTLKKKRA